MSLNPDHTHYTQEDLARLISDSTDPESFTLRQNIVNGFKQVAEELLDPQQPLGDEQADHIAQIIMHTRTHDFVAERFDALYSCFKFYHYNGQPFKAIRIAERAREIAREGRAAERLHSSAHALGLVYANTQHLAGSFQCLEEALRVANELKDASLQTKTWLSIGVSLHSSNMSKEGIAAEEHAIRLAQLVPDCTTKLQGEVLANTNIALFALHLKDYDKGLAAAQSAWQQAEAAKLHPVQHTILATNYVKLLLGAGEIDAAQQRLNEMRSKLAGQHYMPAELHLEVAQSMCEVASGQADIGLTRLTKLHYQAIGSYRPAYLDTLRALIEANERAGRHKEAAGYVRELLGYQSGLMDLNVDRHLSTIRDRMLLSNKVGEPLLPFKVKLGEVMGELERNAARLRLLAVEDELREQESFLEHYAISAELIDDATGEHCYRVGRLASLLAREYGCDEKTIATLEIAARLHDIGKAGVNPNILAKPGPLDQDERRAMELHTKFGGELLEKFHSPQLTTAAVIARNHHEWWNGQGYPAKRKGEEIPLAARITAIADVFDALSHKRVYKESWPVDRVIRHIADHRGSQFDPDLTDHFLYMMTRLLHNHRKNLDDYLAHSARQSTFLVSRKHILRELEHVV